MAATVPQVPHGVLWAQPQWQCQPGAGPFGVQAPACWHQRAGHGALGAGERAYRGAGDSCHRLTIRGGGEVGPVELEAAATLFVLLNLRIHGFGEWWIWPVVM